MGGVLEFWKINCILWLSINKKDAGEYLKNIDHGVRTNKHRFSIIYTSRLFGSIWFNCLLNHHNKSFKNSTQKQSYIVLFLRISTNDKNTPRSVALRPTCPVGTKHSDFASRYSCKNNNSLHVSWGNHTFHNSTILITSHWFSSKPQNFPKTAD